MFIQVLGIRTSLFITSQSKERPFVLLHNQAILVSQQPLIMSEVRSYHQAKTFLMEDVILPELLLSCNLSDVHEGIFSDSDSDMSVRKKKIVHPEQSYSESQTSYEESDYTNIISNAGGVATTWVKEDKTPNLGPFTGNPVVKQIPSDPTKVSEIIELFSGNNFFEMLCKETNLYYFQNQGKYDSSSKGVEMSYFL
jgi:hypothetical protein